MPSASTHADSYIPIVDLSSSTAPVELLDAAANNGFIFIKHTGDIGLAPEDVDEVFDISKRFFASPVDVKESCTINSAHSGKNHGWLGPGTETLDPGTQTSPDRKEAFNLGPFDPTTHTPRQPLPAPLQTHSKQLGDFMKACHDLCARILTLLGTALELHEQDWFARRHQWSAVHSSVLRLLWYPVVAEPGTAGMRAGAHSDYGSVTLLFRLPGQGGLEILTESGAWVDVPVEPAGAGGRAPILVNVGDVLSYWTKGLLKSTVHRVVLPDGGSGGDRFSVAYFCHPDDEAELVEVPSRVVRESVGGGVERLEGVRTAKDHLNARLAATYGVK